MAMEPGPVLGVIDDHGFDRLIGLLIERGWRPMGPVVRDGAIVHGPLGGVHDLPSGVHDEQAPGSYRLRDGDDPARFAWAVGPSSPKTELFPPAEELWRAVVTTDPDGNEGLELAEAPPPGKPLALIGVRPCELAGMGVLDKVLAGGATADNGYQRRKDGLFVVVVECGSPSDTCFCTSMNTGPDVSSDDLFDVAMTELLDERGHRYLVRAGSPDGAHVLDQIGVAPADELDLAARRQLLADATARMGPPMNAASWPELLASNLEHQRWDEVAERCLSCGNCTLVCPTCFCSDVADVSDLDGTLRRTRRWASCFDLAHSHLHGGPVRASTPSRYRQWLTHKLSTWWDQFGTSGCVGCGRCITWCPVGIDLREEVTAIAAGTDTAGPGEPRGET